MLELHRKYLLSKINVIIIVIVILIITIVLLVSIKLNYSPEIRWLNRETCTSNYLQNMIFAIKLMGIIFASYLMGNAFNLYADSYSVLFLRNKVGKIKYFFGKLLMLLIVTTLLLGVLLLVGTTILYILGSWFTDWQIIFKISLNLITVILVYGLLSIIFTILFKSNFAFVLAIVAFLGMEISSDIINETNIYNVLSIFLPVLNYSDFIGNFVVNVMMICTYSLAGGILYYHQNN